MRISMETRGMCKKGMPGELAKDAGLTAEEEIRSMLQCIDLFGQELNV